jgi:hypothetical protein
MRRAADCYAGSIRLRPETAQAPALWFDVFINEASSQAGRC